MSSPSLATSLRLAIAGSRSDRMRIALTAIGAFATTVLFCLAASVAFIGEASGPYRFDVLNQPGLRPGVIISMLALTIPTLVFVGQCSRFGAPSRDRRLARLRMAGAQPSEVARIVALETGLASLLGSLAGAGTFFIAKRQFSTEHVATITTQTELGGGGIQIDEVTTTVRLLPTDVTFTAWSIVLLVAVVPLLATMFSSIALRKVIVSPFGVARTQPTAPPTVLPAVLFGAGTLALVGWSTISEALDLHRRALPIVVIVSFCFFIMIVAGLITGGGSIAAAAGHFIAPRTDRPSLLIAGRRLISAPYTSARATTSVLLAVFIGSAVQATREAFLVGTDPTDTFYADTFDLLNVVLIAAIVLSAASLLVTTTEAVVERRRNLAALTAAGTPRSTLARSLLAETLIPLVPSVLLAATAGVLSARGLFGTRVETWDPSTGRSTWLDVHVPLVETATLAVGAIIVCAVVSSVSFGALQRSVDVSELRTAA